MGNPMPTKITVERFNPAVAAAAALEGRAKLATDSHSNQVIRRRVF
jgi:hypothetical protein